MEVQSVNNHVRNQMILKTIFVRMRMPVQILTLCYIITVPPTRLDLFTNSSTGRRRRVVNKI